MTIEEYILAHIEPEPELLRQLNRQTHQKIINPRMLSGHLQGRILKMLTQMCQARTILELGTFTGYSALCFAEGLPDDGVLHTVEENDELEDFARDFFHRSEYGHKIVQHIGKALDVIQTLDCEFDLVFLDADKREYTDYYRAVFDKLKAGGYLLADNTLWDGKVLHTPDPRDAQTIALQAFNNLVATDPRVETVILPLRDGLTVIRKK
ncbi:MAG: O-methyltransferase [Prevotellaceae bacterium]|jgi:predicted O-methyltransferase YrrM|nr:O-methyltransferase [Prevotellaceae bacterium]